MANQRASDAAQWLQHIGSQHEHATTNRPIEINLNGEGRRNNTNAKAEAGPAAQNSTRAAEPTPMQRWQYEIAQSQPWSALSLNGSQGNQSGQAAELNGNKVVQNGRVEKASGRGGCH